MCLVVVVVVRVGMGYHSVLRERRIERSDAVVFCVSLVIVNNPYGTPLALTTTSRTSLPYKVEPELLSIGQQGRVYRAKPTNCIHIMRQTRVRGRKLIKLGITPPYVLYRTG